MPIELPELEKRVSRLNSAKLASLNELSSYHT